MMIAGGVSPTPKRGTTHHAPALDGLEFVESKGHLHARLSPAWLSERSALGYLAEIILKCAEKRQKRLLIEFNGSDLAVAADFLRPLGTLVRMSGGMKIALVQPDGHDGMHSFEHEVATEGGADFRYFTDLPEARSWVVESPLLDWLPTLRK